MAPDSVAAAPPSLFLDIENLPWIDTGPGNQMKILYHDKVTGLLTVLTKLAAGAGIPEHTHEDLEQTFVLEGSLEDHEGACTAGNFVMRPKGSRHAPVAPNGCTMLVFFMKPTKHLERMLEKRGG